jgi:ribosomal protein S18 acetylase RimI-like enzyme
MIWQTTHSLDEFEAATKDFVGSDPVRNILLANIPRRLRRQGLALYGDTPPRFGWIAGDDGVPAVFVQTPPYQVLVSALPAGAVESFVDVVVASGGVMGGINAPLATATAVAAAWTARTGRTATVAQHLRLFRLGELVPPDPMPEGSARAATAADRDLAVAWYVHFADHSRGPRPPDPGKLVDDALARGAMLLWEAGGEPVALAAWVGQEDGGTASIGPVYTPEHRRRRGYAAAATAEACRRASAAGAGTVVLFTDVQNATANGVYRRIGFTEVEDRQIIDFEG